nr:MAG TPA: hypothetical protein [Caudoviricetes sp.]
MISLVYRLKYTLYKPGDSAAVLTSLINCDGVVGFYDPEPITEK